MRFNILGSLEARSTGQSVQIAGRRPRALLALLIAHANQHVSAAQLIDMLWEGSPPRGAATTLRGYVSSLRRALAAHDHRSGDEIIVTGPGGYELRVRPSELDAEEFSHLLARAREERAKGDLRMAADTLAYALSLWRGEPFSDVSLSWLDTAYVPQLRSQRRTALSERIEVALELGEHREILPELEALVAANPLDEALRGLLMQAL